MLDSDDPRSYVERVHIHYEGRFADGNSIPLDDLIDSLHGWEQFFHLTTTIYIRGNLDPRPLPAERRPQLRIREVRSGSIIAVLEFVGLAAAGGIIAGASWESVKYFARRLAQFRKDAIRRHLEVKRMSEGAIEQVVAALRELAEDADRRDRQRDNPDETIRKMDSSLDLATHPIDTSVDKITLDEPEFRMRSAFSRRERRIITSPFAEIVQSEDTGDWHERDIKIFRLNQRSGSCSFTFIKPTDEDEQGIHQTTVTDLALRRRYDPYSKSMYEREATRVWVRKVIVDSKLGAYRWEISTKPPLKRDVLFA